MREMDERYRTDDTFARLVDMIYHACLKGQFTPSEVREAALLAQLKYEMDHPRPIKFSASLEQMLREGKFK